MYLPLVSEVGRLPEEKHLCEFCELYVVEDKFHFIFYRSIRI